MSGLSEAFPESFEDILAAVKETPRGRWFLEGLENRIKSTDTTRILEAIAKLERHIQSVPATAQDTGLVQRARDAIAAARRDIAAIADKPASLSVEGQMFARMASLSKEAFTQQPALGQGVQRALSLVADLDREFNAAAPPQQNNRPDPFKQDEAVFEPAPTEKPAQKPDIPVETQNRGAKLIIQRVAPQTEPAPAPAPEPEAAASLPAPDSAPASETPVLESTPPAAADIPQSRIVIIRRKAEEMNDVPLLGMDADEATPPDTVAAAS